MDINRFISSTVRPSTSDSYYVQFPSFTGYVEAVFYKQGHTNLTIGASELTPIFQSEHYSANTECIILVSRILGNIGVRIFSAKNIYDEKKFLILGGEIFSFEILGKPYMGFIYKEVSGQWGYYTNLPLDIPFRATGDHTHFHIENTLLGSTVFSFEANFVKANCYSPEQGEKSIHQKLLYIPDMLFPGKSDIFTEFLLAHHGKILSDEGIIEADLSSISEHDFHRCAGFMGMYNTIISEEIPGLPGYLKMSEVNDSKFELPESFHTSEQMEYLDPRWHKMRLGLLELQYLLFRLQKNLSEITISLEELDKLENVHIIAQKQRLLMKKNQIDLLLHSYYKMREALINRLQSKLNI